MKVIYHHEGLKFTLTDSGYIQCQYDYGNSPTFVLTTPDQVMAIAKALINTLPPPEDTGAVYPFTQEDRNSVWIEAGEGLTVEAYDEYSSREAIIPPNEVDAMIRALCTVKT